MGQQVPRESLDQRPAVRLFGDQQEVERRVEPLRVPAAPVIGGQERHGALQRVRAGRRGRGPDVDALRHRWRAAAGVERDAILAGLEISVRRRAASAACAVAEVPLNLRRVWAGAVRLEAREVQGDAWRAQGVVHAPRERHGRRAVRALDARRLGTRGWGEHRGGHGGGGELLVRRVALEVERAVRHGGGGAADVMHLEGMHARRQLHLTPRRHGNARGEARPADLLEDAVGVDEQKRRVLRAEVKFVSTVLWDAQEAPVGRGEVAHVVGPRGVHVLHHLVHEGVADDRRVFLQAPDHVRPARERRAGPVAELDGDSLGQRRNVGVRQLRVACVSPIDRVVRVACELDERLAVGLMGKHGDRQYRAILPLHADVRAIGPQPARRRQSRDDALRLGLLVRKITDEPQRKAHAIARHPGGRGQVHGDGSRSALRSSLHRRGRGGVSQERSSAAQQCENSANENACVWTAVAERSGDTAFTSRGAVGWLRLDRCAGRQSGVALRFPPQSKTSRVGSERGVSPALTPVHT